MDVLIWGVVLPFGTIFSFICMGICLTKCLCRYSSIKNERQEEPIETENQLRQRLELGLQLEKLHTSVSDKTTEVEYYHLETEKIEVEQSMAQKEKRREQFWSHEQETPSHDQKSEDGMEIEEDDKSHEMHMVLKNV